MKNLTIALLALMLFPMVADAFDPPGREDVRPIDLPEPRPVDLPREPCLPGDCVRDAFSQYSTCVAFAVIDGDTETANRCAIEANIRLGCCRGVAAPGVICP